MSAFLISCDGFQEPCSDADYIISRIEQIAARQRELHGIPVAVELIRADAPIADLSSTESMSIGIGDGEWILFYYPGDGSEHGSVGDDSAVGNTTFYFGDWTSLSRRYLVPKRAAIEAVRNWIETGEVGGSLRWTTELL
jgi:hypothetical protein